MNGPGSARLLQIRLNGTDQLCAIPASAHKPGGGHIDGLPALRKGASRCWLPFGLQFALLGSSDSVDCHSARSSRSPSAAGPEPLAVPAQFSCEHTGELCRTASATNGHHDELVANLHTIYLNHLTQPDAEFELNCRAVPVDGAVPVDRRPGAFMPWPLRGGQRPQPRGTPCRQGRRYLIPTYGQPAFTLHASPRSEDLLISRHSISSTTSTCASKLWTMPIHSRTVTSFSSNWLIRAAWILQSMTAIWGFSKIANQAVSTSRSEFHRSPEQRHRGVPGWLLGLIETFQQQQNVGLAGSNSSTRTDGCRSRRDCLARWVSLELRTTEKTD